MVQFFPISATVAATTGISSFTVRVNLKDGSSQNFDNNGAGYPVSDAVMLQKPQSCLLTATGALTVTAAVRNDRATLPVNLGLSFLVPQADPLVTPALNNASVALTKGNCAGGYTLFSGTYNIPGGKSSTARLDVSSGSGADVVVDAFKAASELPGACIPFTGGTSCSDASSTSSTVSSTSGTSASATPTGPSQPATVGAWRWYGCQTEATGARALSAKSFAADTMTLDSCSTFCAGYNYFGVEYAREWLVTAFCIDDHVVLSDRLQLLWKHVQPRFRWRTLQRVQLPLRRQPANSAVRRRKPTVGLLDQRCFAEFVQLLKHLVLVLFLVLFLHPLLVVLEFVSGVLNLDDESHHVVIHV